MKNRRRLLLFAFIICNGLFFQNCGVSGFSSNVVVSGEFQSRSSALDDDSQTGGNQPPGNTQTSPPSMQPPVNSGGQGNAYQPLSTDVCSTAIANAYYVDKDHPNSSDSNNGQYASNDQRVAATLRHQNGNGPFKTIQKLIDTLQGGQCGFVRASSTAYTEVNYRSGAISPMQGILVRNKNGSVGNLIVISAFPGEKPLIDQKKTAPPSGIWGTAGFYVYNSSYVVIRGFEIINTMASLVHIDLSTYISVEHNLLHHSYVSENGGGVKLDDCHHCVIKNNTIHDVHRTFNCDSWSNPFNNEPYCLNTGIHAYGYGSGFVTVSRNIIYNAGNAIYQKCPSDKGDDAFHISENIMFNLTHNAYEIHQARGVAGPQKVRFHDNLVYNVQMGGVNIAEFEASTQGKDAYIYNNTFIDVKGMPFLFQNMTNINVYNNIVLGTSTSKGSGAVFATVYSGDSKSWINSLSYSDYNLFYQINMVWILDRYHFSDPSKTLEVNSLASWSALTTARHADLLMNYPDSHSTVASPKFTTNLSQIQSSKLMQGDVSDFDLAADSPALGKGRDGVNIGARLKGVKIGY